MWLEEAILQVLLKDCHTINCLADPYPEIGSEISVLERAIKILSEIYVIDPWRLRPIWDHKLTLVEDSLPISCENVDQ